MSTTVAGVQVDPNLVNELNSIDTFSVGLSTLAMGLRRRELTAKRAIGDEISMTIYLADFDGTKNYLPMIACQFHWFGVTLCNLARMIGFVVGSSDGRISRQWLEKPADYPKVKQFIDDYVRSIPQLASVLTWRNKVGAHVAITDPFPGTKTRPADNIATLETSVIFPVSFSDDRYRVHSFQISKNGHASQIPEWSLTEVFESLIPVFWQHHSADWLAFLDQLETTPDRPV